MSQNLEFFYSGKVVGYFEEPAYPATAGRYRYMPYRGPGHHEMQAALEKGPVRCSFKEGAIRSDVIVSSTPETHVLLVDNVRRRNDTLYRWAAGLALTAAFLIVWMNAAAGLIGIEDADPANLLYVGVLAVGFIGAVIARLRPRGLSRAMFATALALALVGVVALKLPNTASLSQIAMLHSLLVALFVNSALLFRRAGDRGGRALEAVTKERGGH